MLLIFLVFANEGDAYPLGALPLGTQVNCVEKYTGLGGFYAHAAGTCCTIIRRIGDRVIIQLPSKQEVSLPMENMAVVGWYLICVICKSFFYVAEYSYISLQIMDNKA